MKDDLINKAAAIDAVEEIPWYHQTKNGEMVRGVNSREHQAWYKADDVYHALYTLPPAQPDVPDTNVGDINKFIDGLEEIFADIRERHVDDSVCGLCEYDGAYMGQSGDWCNECPGFDRDDCFKLSDEHRKRWIKQILGKLPSAQPAEDIHREKEQAYYCGYEDGAKAARSAQPGWIPWDSGRFPEESGTYTVTAYDGATKRVTYAKYQKRLKRWELTGARAYWRVLAWMPLPKPWEGGQDNGTD